MVSCSDFAEGYTGHYQWGDYQVEADLTPVVGEHHYLNFRVQGAIRSYAVGFCGIGQLALLKNKNGYRTLCTEAFAGQIRSGRGGFLL